MVPAFKQIGFVEVGGGLYVSSLVRVHQLPRQALDTSKGPLEHCNVEPHAGPRIEVHPIILDQQESVRSLFDLRVER